MARMLNVLKIISEAFVFHLLRTLCLDPCPILKSGCVFSLCLVFFISVYILKNESFVRYITGKDFSHSVGCLFTRMMVFFDTLEHV